MKPEVSITPHANARTPRAGAVSVGEVGEARVVAGYVYHRVASDSWLGLSRTMPRTAAQRTATQSFGFSGPPAGFFTDGSPAQALGGIRDGD